MTKSPKSSSRRQFLRTGAATVAAAAVGTVAMPNVSRAQTTTWKYQSTWPTKDIFHEFAVDYASKVNEMSGGRLKLDVLAAGAVVPAFQMADAVHTGILDAGHGVCAYWYGKHKAYSLFGTPPSFGWDANSMLAWFYHGGGEALYKELVNDTLKLNLVGYLYFAMPTQPLGWFKKEISGPESFKGLKYRTVGLATNMFQKMGASVAQLPGPEILPAMERGVIEAFEFNNPTSDMRFGAQDVAKFYYMGSYHQAAEAFEIVFNKAKYESLPKEQQGILRYAAQAAAADNEWKAWDQYSKDLQELITKKGVTVKRTMKSIFDAQLKAWDEVEKDLVADSAQGPFIKKVLDSQKAWAKRVGFYFFNNDADYKTAWEHHFGALKT